MGAFVEHEFNRGFILNEERLRKIHNLIEDRVSKFSQPLQPRFKVYRGDSYSYETESVDAVAAEDNEDWQAITRLEILVSHSEAFKLEMSFSKKGTSLEIVGDDRDAVFLLFSDIKTYMESEVLHGRLLTRSASRIISLLVMCLAMLGFMFFILNETTRINSFADPATVEEVLTSDSVSQKLNFMISEKQENATRAESAKVVLMVFFVALLALMLLVATDSLGHLFRFLFPSNVFLFGKGAKSFDKRRKLVHNIFWVVVVGSVVSAVGGMLVWFITRGG